jgi:hypothetical protein
MNDMWKGRCDHAMNSQPMIWLFRALEAMFFTGLFGCSLVVVISWISIFKEGFSEDDVDSSDFHDEHLREQRRIASLSSRRDDYASFESE